jgi:hypothetical protein
MIKNLRRLRGTVIKVLKDNRGIINIEFLTLCALICAGAVVVAAILTGGIKGAHEASIDNIGDITGSGF